MRDEKLNIFYRIKLWWRFHAKYYHRDFIYGVKNLIKWFPTIWKDRDWDNHFIYEVIGFKLKNQAEYIGNRNWHTMSKREAERMRLVAKLIKLQQEDFYTMEFLDYQETKYDFKPVNGGISYEVETTTLSENYEDFFKKYPRQYKKVLSGEIDRYGRSIDEKDNLVIATEISIENQKRCKELIFKIMNQHIESWWD